MSTLLSPLRRCCSCRLGICFTNTAARGYGCVRIYNLSLTRPGGHSVQGHLDAALMLYKERGALPCVAVLKLKAARFQASAHSSALPTCDVTCAYLLHMRAKLHLCNINDMRQSHRISNH